MSRLMRLRCIEDPTGSLTPLDVQDVPFHVERVWFLHDIPEGGRRGGHAHRRLEELIIAVSGSFDVSVEGKLGRTRFHLNRATTGLYVPPGEWRSLSNFSSNAVALVLASTEYDPSDYIFDHAEFVEGLGPVEPRTPDRTRPFYVRKYHPEVEERMRRLHEENAALMTDPANFDWVEEFYKP